jgi:hypothetical protein
MVVCRVAHAGGYAKNTMLTFGSLDVFDRKRCLLLVPESRGSTWDMIRWGQLLPACLLGRLCLPARPLSNGLQCLSAWQSRGSSTGLHCIRTRGCRGQAVARARSEFGAGVPPLMTVAQCPSRQPVLHTLLMNSLCTARGWMLSLRSDWPNAIA